MEIPSLMYPQKHLLFLDGGEYYIMEQLKVLPKNNQIPISQILEFIVRY